MKKNQPSPSKVQNLEQDPALSPSPSLNPEATHTTPPLQSPPPSGSGELNAPPTSEEGYIYDSPSSSTHATEDNGIYFSPPSPGNSSLNEGVYDAPTSSDHATNQENTEQIAEDFIYDTSPSNRPLTSREPHQLIYDVPSGAAQPHARREHVYDVPLSSQTSRSIEAETRAEDNTSVYAEIEEEPEPEYAIIPESSQQEVQEPYTPLSQRKDPLYAALRPKSPVRSEGVEQSAVRSQRRQSIEEMAPELPPRPELLDVYEIPDAEQKAVDATVRSKIIEQNATKILQESPKPRAFRPELPPRPGSVEQSAPKLEGDKSLYSAIGLTPPSRMENKVPSGVPEPKQMAKSDYTNLSSTKVLHSRAAEQSAASSQKRQSTRSAPDLPQRPEVLDVYEMENIEVELVPAMAPIYETIPDPLQSGARAQYMSSSSENVSTHTQDRTSGLQSHSKLLDIYEAPDQEQNDDLVYATIPELPPFSTGQQDAALSPEKDPIYETIPDLSQSAARAQYTPASSEKVSTPIQDIGTKASLRPGSVEQSTTKRTEDKSLYSAVGLKIPPRTKNKVPSDVSESGQKRRVEPNYANTLPRKASQSEDLGKDTESLRTPRNTQQSSERISPKKSTGRAFRPELPPRPGSAAQSASVSSIPSPNLPPKRFSYSKDGIPSDGSELGVEYGHVYATVGQKILKRSSSGEQTTPQYETDSVFRRASSNLSQTRASLLNQSQEVKDKIIRAELKNSVRRLCRTVYGKSHYFDSQMIEIEKNPDLAQDVSMQLSSSPGSFRKLAGTNVCGFKNGRRKMAETGICELVKAIESYGSAVKSSKERQGPSEREVEPLKEIAPLSEYDLRLKIMRTPAVQESRQNIRFLCKQIFGNYDCFQYSMQEIERDPNMAERLAWQIENHPTFFGKLMGHQFFGVKTDARKTAEQSIGELSAAIRGYPSCVTQARENILQKHEEKVDRHKLFTEDIKQFKGLQKENANLSKKTAKIVSESSHHRMGGKKLAGSLSV